MSQAIRIFRTTTGNWIDPWGKPHPVRKIMQSRVVVETPETLPIDPGYGPEHVYQGKVFVDAELRRYLRVSPTDFGGQTYWAMIDPPTNKEAAKFWTAAVSLPAVDRKGHPCSSLGVKL